MIVTRRGCFGNVWKRLRNIEELHENVKLENEFLRKKNEENEELIKKLSEQHRHDVQDVIQKLTEEKQALQQEKEKVELYLAGETKMRIEKEKELQLYIQELEKKNQYNNYNRFNDN